MAEKIMPMRAVTNVKMRRCLGPCGKLWKSPSSGVRICPACRIKQMGVGKCEQTCSGKRLNGVGLER